MNDESHIGFVNSHSKGYCGNNYIHIFHQKFILISRTGSRIHPCMVRQHFYAVYRKYFSNFFNFFPA